MDAVIVSVDYSGELGITLPYNRSHFDRVFVVTDKDDYKTWGVADRNDCRVFVTDAFTRDGARFNKFLAMEEALKFMAPSGWLAILDADVMWPKSIDTDFVAGNLYTPRRRILPDLTSPIPHEPYWKSLRMFQEDEFAGYTQIFHTSDPVLGPLPWHETNWRHAGGPDSFFQAKWPDTRKIRPSWEVLHLGEICQNWCGRVTQRMDGTVPDCAVENAEALNSFMRGRVAGPDPYRHEKL